MDTHETKIFTAVLIAAGIIGIIITYFIIIVIRNQRRHLQLQQQYLLTEITTLEKERKRIVSDLHDELGPILSVVKFQVSSIETNHQEEIELINKASNNLDNILERIRGICNELMPQVLIRKGLMAALREFIAEITDQSPIQIIFRHSNVTFSSSAEIHVYRIIQELLNNALKHSRANEIIIDMYYSNSKIVMMLSDNGIGFDAEEISKNSEGLGLKNILSRTEVLKGVMYVDTKPGEGAKFTIEIPNKNGSPDTTRNSR